MKPLLRAIAVVLVVGALTSASAADYVITDLGSLGIYAHVEAYGINNSGQVVGTAFTTDLKDYRAFLYSNGAIQNLGTPEGSKNRGNGINDSGQVVGVSDGHAFLYSNGVMQDLTPDAGSSEAYGINNSGQVVGTAFTTDLKDYHAFLYSNGVMQDIAGSSEAYGINDSGQVVGVSDGQAFLYSNGAIENLGTLYGKWSDAYGINNSGQVVGVSDYRAFLYSNGAIKNLGTLTLDGKFSEAYGINDSGQVVGVSDYRAFLYNGTLMLDLNALNISGLGDWLSLLMAFDINNAGQICGFGERKDGSKHSFLLTPVSVEPVPEPATMLLLGSGLAGLAGLRRKIRKN